MNYRSLLSAAMFVAATFAAGQTVTPAVKTTPAKKAYTAPRTADGHPDLQGVWTNNTVTPFERPKGLGAKEFYTDAELAQNQKRRATASR